MTKPRSRTDHRIGRAGAPRPPAAAPIAGDGEVARRAYALYPSRGGEHGHDVEDWLQAEREVNREALRRSGQMS